MTDYVALRGIQAPGTAVFGYQRGDRVDETVVANWNLATDGPDADVAEGTELPAEPAEPVVVRPDEGATRAQWEAYAVAGGMKQSDAAVASLEDLQDAPEPVRDDVQARPADSAKKADWAAYVTSLGADESWVNADTTTKSDLIGYQTGDTVAVAATEANNG